MVVVFSLAVGTVLDAAIGSYHGKQTGETSLFRKLTSMLSANDVILADRCFSGWFGLAMWRQRGVEYVVRKHQLRPTDFRTGQRVGKEDQLATWRKPQRPSWMTND